MPAWKGTTPPEATCNLSRHTEMRVQYGQYGFSSCHIYFGSAAGWPETANPVQQELATLRFIASEMENALPILRAMIAEAEGEAKP